MSEEHLNTQSMEAYPNQSLVDLVWKVVNGLALASIIGIVTWIWSVNSTIIELRTRLSAAEECVAAAHANDVQIQVIQTQLSNIKEGITEIKGRLAATGGHEP
jgi:hypothetical protein